MSSRRAGRDRPGGAQQRENDEALWPHPAHARSRRL